MSDHAATKEFKLFRPIMLGDQPLESITLKEPLALHVEIAERNAINDGNGTLSSNGMAIHLIALVSSQNIQTIRNLSSRDYMNMRGYLNGFLEPSPPTGGN